MIEPLWGIDLGGTKIEGVILENRISKRVLKRTRIATEAHKGYTHIVKRIGQLVEVMTTETGLKPSYLGIGTPGIFDRQLRAMKNCNTTALNGRNLPKDLEHLLNIPIRIANDANCFAMAETHMGIVPDLQADATLVFGVIMGTGVGGAIVWNGQLLEGRQGISGEWGHTFLDESAGRCYCGSTGCVENLISGPALERYYLNESGQQLKLSEIIKLYEGEEDLAAAKTIERLIYFFGKGIAQIINILDPDVIVLGGGLGNIDLLYTEGVAQVAKNVFNHRLETVFLKPKLGDSAGVFGAALL